MGRNGRGALSPGRGRAIGAALLLCGAVLAASGSLQRAAGALPSPGAAALGPAAATLLGLVLLAAAAAHPALREAWSDGAWAYGLGLAGGLALTAALMVWTESAVIGGRRWFWLQDDAMVSMRFAQRWAQGKGLTWTDGAAVEGYSNFLWTLVMGVVHRLGAGPALAPAWILALNLAGLAWLASATRRLALGLGADPLGAALAGLACAFSVDAVGAALSGLEGVAVGAVAAEAMAALAGAERRRAPAPLAACLWASLLPLLRADGALAAGLLWLLFARRAGRPARAAGGLALALAPGLAHLGWRHAAYGAWLPNTYALKAGAWPGKYSGGALKALRGVLSYPLALAAAALGARQRAAWAWVLAVLLLYTVWTGPDYFPHLRYFAPGWPLFFALAFAALPRAPWPALRRAAAAWLLLLAGANAAWGLPALLDAGWDFAAGRERLGLALRRRVAPDESVASAWAGTFYYLSERRGVDLLGKCDPVVARAPVDPAVAIPGHNRMDLDWSLGRLRPDWVVSELPVPGADGLEMSSFDMRLATHPLFVKHCLPHAEAVEGRWMLCRCRW